MPQTIQRWCDFDISFQAHPVTKDILLVTGTNAVVQAIINLVQLNHYEKFMHPEIGGNVRKLLFELADPVVLSSLSDEIKDLITNFEPRVNVVDVLIDSNIQSNGFNVTIVFFLVNNTNPITVSFFLERLR